MNAKIDNRNVQILNMYQQHNKQFKQILQTIASKRKGAPEGDTEPISLRKRFVRTAPSNPHVSSSDSDVTDSCDDDSVVATPPDTGAGNTPGPIIPDTGNDVPQNPPDLLDNPPDPGDAIMEELFPTQTIVLGPKVHDKVAAYSNTKWIASLTKGDIDAMGDIVVPENISAIHTPMLNPEIWTELSRPSRSTERRTINLQ